MRKRVENTSDEREVGENSANDASTREHVEPVESPASETESAAESGLQSVDLPQEVAENISTEQDPAKNTSTTAETEDCGNCIYLNNELRKLKNQVKMLQGKLSEHRKEKKAIKRQLGKYVFFCTFLLLNFSIKPANRN